MSACLLAIDRVNVKKVVGGFGEMTLGGPGPQGCPRLTLHEEVP